MSRSLLRTRAVRPFEWAFPVQAARCEVVSIEPDQPSDKPPILFVHGLRHASWCWREKWMPELARRGWPVHAIDLRGHGASEGKERIAKTRLRDYAHDVMQAVIKLPERPVLVGHSMGGYVVQRVMELYTPRAGVLVAPSPTVDGQSITLMYAKTKPAALALALAGRPLPLNTEDLFSDELDRAEVAGYMARLEGASPLVQWELTLSRRLSRVNAPVQILATPEDRVIPAAGVKKLARALGVEPVWFPGMAHDMMLDARWLEPLDAMERWLDDLTSRAVA